MLGNKYSDALGARFLDANGKEHPFIMGSYGIGITRTPQAAIEKYHDDKGIIWPKNIAPYQAIIIPLNMASEEHRKAAEQIYADLRFNQVDCILDDRSERAGVKFNDADLIGIPVQVVIGDKSLKQGKIELKNRQTGDTTLADLGGTGKAVAALLAEMN